MHYVDFGYGKIKSITNTQITFAGAGLTLPTEYPFKMAYWRAKTMLPNEDPARRVITITGHASGNRYTYTSDTALVALMDGQDYYAFNVADAAALAKLHDEPTKVFTAATFTPTAGSVAASTRHIAGTWAIGNDPHQTFTTGTVDVTTGVTTQALIFSRLLPKSFSHFVFEAGTVDGRTGDFTASGQFRMSSINDGRTDFPLPDGTGGTERALLVVPTAYEELQGMNLAEGQTGVFIDNKRNNAFTLDGTERVVVSSAYV